MDSGVIQGIRGILGVPLQRPHGSGEDDDGQERHQENPKALISLALNLISCDSLGNCRHEVEPQSRYFLASRHLASTTFPSLLQFRTKDSSSSIKTINEEDEGT